MAKVTRVDIPEGVVFNNAAAPLKFMIYDLDGAPLNVSAYEWIWAMRENPEDVSEEGEPIIVKATGNGITVAGSHNNEVTVLLTASDLDEADVDPGVYWHGLRRDNAGAETMALWGTIVVTGSAIQ